MMENVIKQQRSCFRVPQRHEKPREVFAPGRKWSVGERELDRIGERSRGHALPRETELLNRISRSNEGESQGAAQHSDQQTVAAVLRVKDGDAFDVEIVGYYRGVRPTLRSWRDAPTAGRCKAGFSPWLDRTSPGTRRSIAFSGRHDSLTGAGCGEPFDRRSLLHRSCRALL